MKSMRMIVIAATMLALPALITSAASASPIVLVGGYTSASFPTGNWGKVAGFGLGLENVGSVFPDSTRPFGIRQGSSLIYNFKRTVDVPSANIDTNTSLQAETANTSLWFGIGPELRKHTGDARPFIYGTVGVAFNWINSHLKGNVQGAGYDATVGQTSTTFAWTAGAGVSKAVSSVPGGAARAERRVSLVRRHALYAAGRRHQLGLERVLGPHEAERGSDHRAHRDRERLLGRKVRARLANERSVADNPAFPCHVGRRERCASTSPFVSLLILPHGTR